MPFRRLFPLARPPPLQASSPSGPARYCPSQCSLQQQDPQLPADLGDILGSCRPQPQPQVRALYLSVLRIYPTPPGQTFTRTMATPALLALLVLAGRIAASASTPATSGGDEPFARKPVDTAVLRSSDVGVSHCRLQVRPQASGCCRRALADLGRLVRPARLPACARTRGCWAPRPSRSTCGSGPCFPPTSRAC